MIGRGWIKGIPRVIIALTPSISSLGLVVALAGSVGSMVGGSMVGGLVVALSAPSGMKIVVESVRFDEDDLSINQSLSIEAFR